MNPQRVRSIDGVVISAPANARSPQPAVNSIHRPYAIPQAQHKRRASMPEYIQLPLIIASGMLFGVLVQSAVLAQLAIIIYGIVALIRGIPSRITFTFALLALLATVVLLIMQGDTLLSHNFAVYTFLFLVVGVITLNREIKKEGSRLYSIRKNTY